MINENDVIDCGVPEGPLVDIALEIAETYPPSATKMHVIDHIERVVKNPQYFVDMPPYDDKYRSIRFAELTDELASGLLQIKNEQAGEDAIQPKE